MNLILRSLSFIIYLTLKNDNLNGQIRAKEGIRITILGMVVNIILTALKIFAGLLGRSSAVLADGIHSLSDIATDIIVIFGISFSGKPRDEGHDFGHGKFETIVTALVGLFLIGVGGGIMFSSIRSFWNFSEGVAPEKPGWITVIVAVLSILLKEIIFRMTMRKAEMLESGALKANAWHHRTDSFSSIAVLIGVSSAIIIGGRWTILDPIAAAFVSLLIIKVAWDLLRNSIMELSEASLDRNTEERIMSIITSVKEARDPHNLRTRRIGSTIAIDVHIKAPGDLPLKTAHDISLKVERKIRSEFGEETYIHVHMDPDDV
jgi:cation diffusion facilitator family transporter